MQHPSVVSQGEWLAARTALLLEGKGIHPSTGASSKDREETEKEANLMKLHTYLNYGGNCEQAFRFYEKHLGGKITMLMTQGQQPDAKDVPSDQKDAILYARMSLGETDLMGSDVPSERFKPMRSVYLSLSVNTIAEAERIVALLSDGAEIFMPMQETFFAIRFAMLRDKFGTSWMIINERPPQQNT
jgi:PhnB protein